MLLALNWVQFASIPFQAKADTPVEDTDGDTQAPKLAAQPSIAALIKALLSAGASMSSGLNVISQTPMHIAARYGDEQLAHLLMDQGADIDARDKGGNTALLLAVKHGQPTLAQALIKMGVNVHLRNNQGHIALFVALGIEDCDRKLCSELICHGEPAQDLRTVAPFLRKAASEGDVPALTFLTSLSVRISINTGYDGGWTVLHDAASNHRLGAVRWLLDHGADVTATTESGYTPLHSSASASPMNPLVQVRVIQLLLARGADPTATTKLSQTPRQTAKNLRRRAAVDVLQKAELAHQLITAGGAATTPRAVAIRFGGPPGAGKSTLTKALLVKRRWHLF